MITTVDFEPRVLRIDGGTQIRVEINQYVVAEYTQAMINGDQFPPVDVFVDDHAVPHVADGHHRVLAAIQAGKVTIPVNVHEGGIREAILFACGANGNHGLRRTNEDKRKAVGLLLADDTWRGWSDRKIAEACGVTHPFVASLRPQLETVTSSPAKEPATTRIGRDNRKRKKPKRRTKLKLANLPDPDSAPAADAPASEPQTIPVVESVVVVMPAPPASETHVDDPPPASPESLPPPDLKALEIFREISFQLTHYFADVAPELSTIHADDAFPLGKIVAAFNAVQNASEAFSAALYQEIDRIPKCDCSSPTWLEPHEVDARGRCTKCKAKIRKATA